jgi:phosphoglycolate phosphatase
MHAALFDLDGTLVDSIADLRTALNTILAEDGRAPLTPDQVRAFVGDGARVLVQRAYGKTGGLPATEAGMVELVARFLAAYDGCLLEHTRPYEGVLDVLDALRDRGTALAVCTNKPGHATRRILDGLGLTERFACVLGGDDVPRKKPDPGHLRAALGPLGVSPDRATMVGDGPNDVLSGRAAGIRTIAVAWGYSDATTLGADLVAETPAQLLGYLQRP